MRSPKRQFKDAIYEQFARIGKALSSPKRLELLELLAQGERTVEALAREADLSLANASQHLQVLRSARLVEAEKKGLFVTYRLADEKVLQFLHGMRALAENHLAEIEQIMRRFLMGNEDMQPVNRETLLEQVRKGEVTVLDVRPVEEYHAGHIAGSISIPLKELEHRLAELPTDQEIVAYCRGPYCVFAVEAVEMLRAHGFRARRLEEGLPEWKVAGFPVAVGD